MDKLKPCPFCGSSVWMNRFVSVGVPSGDAGYTAEIKCAKCHLSMRFWALKEEWVNETAIKYWNRRVNDG